MKKNKIIYLQGGFGNVLFQIVFHMYLEQIGHKSSITRCLTKKNIITNFLGWKIHDESYLTLLSILNIEEKSTTSLQTILRLLFGRYSQLKKRPFLNTYFFQSDFKESYLDKTNIFFGYYQDKNFLDANRGNIKIIGEKLKQVIPKIPYKHDIVIHYRYGDSNWARKHYDYYEKVLCHVKNNSNLITVVTDSPQEAKQFFKDLKNINILSNSPLEDFSLMIQAEILYVAPSTFSFWAYLCLDSDKTAILPIMLVSFLGNPGRAKEIVL